MLQKARERLNEAFSPGVKSVKSVNLEERFGYKWLLNLPRL